MPPMPPVKDPVFFVIGSTGTGKSKVAVQLARELKSDYDYKNVVIINCDVYQCFDALPISTNKPSAAELGNIPHAFLGFLESDGTLINCDTSTTPEEAAARAEALNVLQNEGVLNVHTYEKMVTSFIAAYFKEYDDAAVVVCGGTCYYIQALLFSNSLVYDEDGGSVCEDEDKNSENDSISRWEHLNAIDAEVASRYHPNDTRRIERLLEIYKNTGRKPSTIFKERECKLRFGSRTTYVVWTQMERAVLDQSLDARVDEMLRRGMLDEVRAFWLRFKGNPPPNSLSEAIGCKEFLPLFTARSSAQVSEGEVTDAVEQVKANTRRYARRQERWIKNRLVRLLQSTPLKEQWHHFFVFPTEKGNEALLRLKSALQMLLTASPDHLPEGFVFPLKETIAAQSPVTQQKCDICGMLVYGREQMEAHLASKRHRGTLRRLALEKEQRELYGRELPAPKRKRGA